MNKFFTDDKSGNLDFSSLDNWELRDLVIMASQRGEHALAAAATNCLVNRIGDTPAPLVHRVPKWLRSGVFSHLWAQKAEGEGKS